MEEASSVDEDDAWRREVVSLPDGGADEAGCWLPLVVAPAMVGVCVTGER